MSVNELEERRVIRLLADLADDAAPLSRADERELLRRAARGAAAPRRRARRLPAVAAAAAVLLAGAVASSTGSRDSGERPPVPGGAVAFPEGSALRLLLSRAGAAS